MCVCVCVGGVWGCGWWEVGDRWVVGCVCKKECKIEEADFTN